jgi:hypothetical protein
MAETIGVLILSTVAPNAVGIAGFSLASTTVVGVQLTTIIGTAAILAASIGLSYALRPDVPKPEDGSQALKQAIPPRIRGYGRNRLSGYYMLYEAGGSAPATSYDVIAFHSGRVGSVPILYLSDDPVQTSTDISDGGTGTVLDSYGDGRYANLVTIEMRLGDPGQVALSSFISDPLINGIWTAAHYGAGIAHAGLRCGSPADPSEYSRIYPRGKPELSVVANCSPCWDPRDLSQDREDESSWQVSHNPVIHLIDYLTRVDGGMGLDLDTILPPAKLAEWMIEADLCDEQITNADGNLEPRYQSDGWFKFDNKPEDVVGAILSTCDGWLAEPGDGTLSLTVGHYREPTDPPITEKHILGFSLNYGQADEQLVNQLDITYTAPDQKYVSVQAEPWRDEEAIALTGVVRAQPLDLKWVQNYSQARRLADRAMQRLNPLMTGSFTTSLYGLRYLGKRWLPLQYPFVSGLQDCVVEIQSADVDLLAGRIVWEFIRIAPDAIEAYDPDTDEGTAPPVPPPGTHFISLDFAAAFNSQYIALLEDI